MASYAALCAVGAEKVLAHELTHLGYTPRDRAAGRVSFDGADDAIYRANLCLRTADRVYLQVARFEAANFDDLFAGVYVVRWHELVRKSARILVDKVRTRDSTLSAARSVQAVAHKAIYQQLQDRWKMASLPETGASASVRLFIDKNTVSVLLDTSGDPLYQRGYQEGARASGIRESLAAVLLHLLLWKRKTPLHVPFCASAVIACDAALYAYNIPPGLARRFAFEDLALFDDARYEAVRREAIAGIRPDCLARITGSDLSPQAVRLAQGNAEHALAAAGRALQSIGSDARLPRPTFIESDFRDLAAPYDEGLLLACPPDAVTGDLAPLLSAFAGWQIAFLSEGADFEARLGKKAQKVRTLVSGKTAGGLYVYGG